jgi:hypothetical protein
MTRLLRKIPIACLGRWLSVGIRGWLLLWRRRRDLLIGVLLSLWRALRRGALLWGIPLGLL